ncbi:MAG: Ig-like domain-containing protein [Taibaiella sp.]|nr:Ig-like domain-containing protein [Taibaiella sp.]
MKKKFILFPAIAVLLYTLLTSNAGGPGGDLTTGGCSCHNSSPSASTAVTMELLNTSLSPVTTYVGGGSYFIRITGTNTGGTNLPKFGFQAKAVQTSSPSTTAGSMSSATVGGSSVDTSGVQIIQHSGAQDATTLVGSGGSGTQYVRLIPWTAPSAGFGGVTLRGVINAVNGDGSDGGGNDKWNTANTAVSELPAITGTASVCMGSTTTFTNTFTGGTWSSSNTSIATVVTASSTTSTVTGVAAGTATITYTAGGNFVTRVVTVNTTPSSISGPSNVCVSQNATYTNGVGGGAWSTGSTSIATIVSGTGVLTGIAPGTTTVIYALGSCSVSTTITVNAAPTLTGSSSVCVGSSTSLTPSLTGGTWSSSNTAVGTVNTSGTPGVVAGIATGTTNITYTATTGCTNVANISVNPVPAAIGGTLLVCSAATVTATNSVSGGTWSTSAGSGTATVASGTGVITGGSAGTANLTYTLPGGCFVTAVVTVNPLPSIITGSTTLCANGTTTLANTTSGGSWVSGNTSVANIGSSSGVVSPVGTAGGSAPISYILATGCQRVTTVNVNAISPVSGAFTVCPSSSTTLSCAPSGGTWTSGTTTIATVNATSGSVTGITSGTSGITYTTSTGCSSSAIVTVNTTAAITGGTNVCQGSNLTLSNSVSGGTWASSTTAVGTISTSGVFTGISGGTSTVTYTTPAGCTSTLVVTVNGLPAAVTGVGAGTFCGSTTISATGGAGGTIYYQGTTSGGTSTATASSSQTVSASGTYYFRAQSSSGCWGPEAAIVVSINPNPAAIGGANAVCVSASTTLTDATAGGTWSSSSTANGTIDNTTGVLTGIATGTTNITYTLSSTGCFTTKVVSVTAAPGAVTTSGAGTFCGSTTISATGGTGGVIYYQGTTSGGTSTAIAATSQTVSASGTYYFRAQSAGGCWGPEGSVTVSINPNPASITGIANFCESSTTTLATTSTGGTWSSSNAAVATVDASGIVTGNIAGTATITFTFTSTGCFTTRQVTVNPLPATISGPTLCVGGSTTYSNSGGTLTYASGTPAVAGLTLAGSIYTLTGLSAGTSIISVSFTSTGCSRTAEATVNPLPAAITGSTSVCVGSTITLGSTTPAGTWSAASGIATVNTTTGEVTGAATGTTTVTYRLPTGCFSTTVITVNPVPAAISGVPVMCEGSTATLSDVTIGGTWISGNTSVALIGSTSGIISGITAGTSVVSYVLATGCFRSTVATVNPLPAIISGTASTCVGSNTTLSSSPSGGTWTSANTSIATVSAATGVVTGVGVGTTNISYTLSTGCLRLTPVTVNPAPTAGTISGSTSLCTGLTSTLTSSVSGGTWTSSNTAVGTIDGTSGVLGGITAGTTAITYTVSGACGTVTTTTEVTVTTSASAGTLSGPSTICNGSTITLASTVVGGTWISGNASVAPVGFTTGVVSGSSVGTASITYTISSSCGTASASRVITVNALPPAIGGTASMCEGASTTLTNSASGTWSSANTSIADVGSSTGIVTGATAGTTTITFTSTDGCIATRTVTVIALPAAIGGSLTLCSGTTTTLTNSSGAGTWSSSNGSVGIIGASTGTLTALLAGNSVINFTLTSTGCVSTSILTVNPTPGTFSGSTSICSGASSTLSSTTSGGTWTSSNATIASVDASTGLVTAGTAGIANITYTLPTTCRRVTSFTVNALPAAIGGTLTICDGGSTTLTNATSGGTWVSSAPTTATIGTSSGIALAVASGTTTITYTATTGCQRTAILTVQPNPAAIGGSLFACAGASETLTNTTSGGIWTSSTTGVATISTAGVVSAISAGTTTVSYTLSTGCSRSATFTVNPLPAAISGTAAVCVGDTRTFSSTPSGGTWSSSATAVGTIDLTSGIFAAISTGNSTIIYTLPTGCARSVIATVNPLPSPVSGAAVCAGSTTTLSGTPSGGTWSAGTPSVATVSAGSGVVTGVSAGTATFTYTLATGCSNIGTVTVNALPTAIAGTPTVCVGATTSLSSTPTGGTWTSISTGVATIGSSTGLLLGVAAGTTVVTYTSPAGCVRSGVFTVNPLPSAGTITGTSTVCVGAVTTLTSSVTGGTWSNLTGKASVNPFGAVTGVASGLDTILYTVTTVCGSATATHPVTVNPLPVAASITGGTDVCLGRTLTLGASSAGGTWNSGSTSVATVSSTGVVTGMSLGTATISYTVTNSCGSATTTVAVTVHPLADAGNITGADSVCQGDTILLSASVTSGTWGTSNATIATVSPTGSVIGVAPGTVTIRYIVANVCSNDTATKVITVRPASACVTSVRNEPVATMLKLYPNPAYSDVTIDAPVAGELLISSLDGKTVQHVKVAKGNTTFTLPRETSSGVYMCRFIGADGNTSIIRLVYNP